MPILEGGAGGDEVSIPRRKVQEEKASHNSRLMCQLEAIGVPDLPMCIGDTQCKMQNAQISLHEYPQVYLTYMCIIVCT